MTPEDKAYQLTEQFYQIENDSYYFGVNWAIAKASALIAVDEIMEFMRMDDEYTETASNANSKWVNYWVEVKQEIEKL